MVKRARSKHFGLPLATMLTEHAKLSPGPESLEQSYRNTIYCAGVQVQEGGMIRSRYCSNRWCPVCGRIKMAKAIKAYLPVVEEWADPHFVTLTVQNCGAEELADLIDRMMEAFKSASRKIKREGLGFAAIRKLECTYGKGYHPHFHVVVEGGEVAYKLRDYWIDFARKKTRRRVEIGAQDVQKADKDSLIELFKYATKLVAKGPEGVTYVSPERLDTIFRALRNRRTYQAYGFRVADNVEEVDDVDARVDTWTQVERRVVWMWDQDMADWVDHQTGECLTGNRPRSIREHEEDEAPEVARAVQGWPERPRPKAAEPLHAAADTPLPEVGLGGDRPRG